MRQRSESQVQPSKVDRSSLCIDSSGRVEGEHTASSSNCCCDGGARRRGGGSSRQGPLAAAAALNLGGTPQLVPALYALMAVSDRMVSTLATRLALQEIRSRAAPADDCALELEVAPELVLRLRDQPHQRRLIGAAGLARQQPPNAQGRGPVLRPPRIERLRTTQDAAGLRPCGCCWKVTWQPPVVRTVQPSTHLTPLRAMQQKLNVTGYTYSEQARVNTIPSIHRWLCGRRGGQGGQSVGSYTRRTDSSRHNRKSILTATTSACMGNSAGGGACAADGDAAWGSCPAVPPAAALAPGPAPSFAEKPRPRLAAAGPALGSAAAPPWPCWCHACQRLATRYCWVAAMLHVVERPYDTDDERSRFRVTTGYRRR